MNCTWNDLFCRSRLPTVDRFFSADVYNEFLYKLSPEIALTQGHPTTVFCKIYLFGEENIALNFVCLNKAKKF